MAEVSQHSTSRRLWWWLCIIFTCSLCVNCQFTWWTEIESGKWYCAAVAKPYYCHCDDEPRQRVSRTKKKKTSVPIKPKYTIEIPFHCEIAQQLCECLIGFRCVKYSVLKVQRIDSIDRSFDQPIKNESHHTHRGESHNISSPTIRLSILYSLKLRIVIIDTLLLLLLVCFCVPLFNMITFSYNRLDEMCVWYIARRLSFSFLRFVSDFLIPSVYLLSSLSCAVCVWNSLGQRSQMYNHTNQSCYFPPQPND